MSKEEDSYEERIEEEAYFQRYGEELYHKYKSAYGNRAVSGEDNADISFLYDKELREGLTFEEETLLHFLQDLTQGKIK